MNRQFHYSHLSAGLVLTDFCIYNFFILIAVDAKWSNGYCFNSEPFFCEMKVTDRPFITPPPNGKLE